MILGIGCDIIEISRIQRSIDHHGELFLNKIFTSPEQLYCQRFRIPTPHYAVRFAAKEAISKAFAVGISSQLSWLDMEISHNETGKPIVLFQPRIEVQFNNPRIEITLSHCKEYAMAVAIWNKE
jgi:holo-[acyl-carrier protein] synthase